MDSLLEWWRMNTCHPIQHHKLSNVMVLIDEPHCEDNIIHNSFVDKLRSLESPFMSWNETSAVVETACVEKPMQEPRINVTLEVQEISVSGYEDGGRFKLKWNGLQTDYISFDEAIQKDCNLNQFILSYV